MINRYVKYAEPTKEEIRADNIRIVKDFAKMVCEITVIFCFIAVLGYIVM